MEATLAELGLNPKEIKIYKTVLKHREVRPAQLAKTVGIKRTTCYHLAHGLVEKGLLVENTAKRPLTFSLAQPSDVERVLLDEKKRLEQRERVLKRFAAELSRVTAAEESYPVPSIRFVPEEKLEQFINHRALTVWDPSMLKTDGTYWGFQDHSYVENFPHVIADYWKRTSKDIQLKMFTNHVIAPTEIRLSRRYPRRQMKFWSMAGNFLSGIWIMGEYVVMVNSRRHPFYLVEIHDATLAHDLREVFKNLWMLVPHSRGR